MYLQATNTLPVGRNSDADDDPVLAGRWTGRPWPEAMFDGLVGGRDDEDEATDAVSQRLQGSSPVRRRPRQPLVRPLLPPSPREFFRALESWEGVVLEVGQETFQARVLSKQGGQEEEAEFPLEELDPEDLALLEPGAVFYWSIGYLERPTGRIKMSEIRLRRLPAWTPREIEEAEAVADELAALFDDAQG